MVRFSLRWWWDQVFYCMPFALYISAIRVLCRLSDYRASWFYFDGPITLRAVALVNHIDCQRMKRKRKCRVLDKPQTSGLCLAEFSLRSADYSIKGGSQTWPTTRACLQEANFSVTSCFFQAWILVVVKYHGQYSTSFWWLGEQ